MSFWREVNDAFLDGLRSPPVSPKVSVRKGISPVDPKRLAAKYQSVSTRLSSLHRDLIDQYNETLGREHDARHSLAHVFAFEAAAQSFHSAEIDAWEERYLFTPFLHLFKRIVQTDPKFQPLPPEKITAVPVDAYFSLSEKLQDLEIFLERGEQIAEVCSVHLFQFGRHILHLLPEDVAGAKKHADLSLSSPLIETLPEPHHELACCGRHFFGLDADVLREHHLLEAFQEQLFQRWLTASGLKLEDLEKKELDTPLNHLKTPASELTKKFLGASPLAKLLLTPVPYGI